MTTTLIISEAKLRQFTDLNDSVDTELLKNAVRTAQDILQVIEDLLQFMYPEEEISVGVQQLKLFADGEEEVDVVTSIDAEIGEDSELEAEIETADKEASVDTDEPITELPLV